MLTCLPFCFTGYIFCKHVAKKGLYYIYDMGNITKTLEVVNVLFSNDRSVQREKKVNERNVLFCISSGVMHCEYAERIHFPFASPNYHCVKHYMFRIGFCVVAVTFYVSHYLVVIDVVLAP